MKNYIRHHEWNVIEEGFDPHLNLISESLFSLGNGRTGMRGNFEEQYSGETLRGSYVAGVYYPDKTRVGWWKNGYPEYFAKVINAPNWIGIDLEIEGQPLDLAKVSVSNFKRVLHMKEGYLHRQFTAQFPDGKQVAVEVIRLLSIVDDDAGVIQYCLTPLNFSGTVRATFYVDADVFNKDSNYDEKFWEEVHKETADRAVFVTARTKKTSFDVCTGIAYAIEQDDKVILPAEQPVTKEKYAGLVTTFSVKQGQKTALFKFGVIASSLNHPKEQLLEYTRKELTRVASKGFNQMLQEQTAAWEAKWKEADIVIEGDPAAQQGIRFNIFQLYQTYTGEDERLNIGPKGFTGEKYGGVTYWDTEAYCIPFYLCTADPHVARKLLVYRRRHLEKAIENAQKLGFHSGAALYPMVTINGEECHNEWEITFEEIHRNGAIAYAIYNYILHTEDKAYLAEHGLEVLLGIARFWAQRVNFSEDKQQYVMLGVTGPNEYENNVNNNWYTNKIAVWCLQYALQAAEYVSEHHPARYAEIVASTNFQEREESAKWQHIMANMYFPYSPELDVFLQQDGYLDKEQILVKDLPAADRPLNQKWSWDRILRSCFIKQADVLQGLYFFEHEYDLETIRRNFDFYEPRTVHESSLSPCIHAVQAALIGDIERAYRFYLRTSRLDLDDYNNDTEDGLHITSMAGTWISVVEGFGGKRVRQDGRLSFNPQIPKEWNAYSFKIVYRGALLRLRVTSREVIIRNESFIDLPISVYDKPYVAKASSELTIQR